jgi:GcrA cell cycle regulator
MNTETGIAKLRAICAAKRGFSDDDMLALIAEGKTVDQICIALDCDQRVIYRIRHRYGLPRLGRRKPASPWNEETIAILRSGWAAGKSTAAIGRELHLSKNAIVGKASRLDLDRRPSPLYPDPEGAPKRVRAVTPRPKAVKPEAPLPPLPRVVIKRAPKPKIVAPAPPKSTPIPTHRGRVTECCWPCGTPRTPSFHYCDHATQPGEPYCEEHMKAGRRVAA